MFTLRNLYEKENKGGVNEILVALGKLMEEVVRPQGGEREVAASSGGHSRNLFIRYIEEGGISFLLLVHSTNADP